MYLLRHGQSYFNLHFSETRVDPGIEDPELTPLGVEQAVAAAQQLAASRAHADHHFALHARIANRRADPGDPSGAGRYYA